MRAFVVALGAALSALVGCSLLVPLDAATGGDAPPGDAGPAEADASASGSSGSSDAGSDAPTEAGAPAPVCPPNAYLCDDFERAAAFSTTWSSAFGTPSTSDVRSVSPTRSLLTGVASNDTSRGLVKGLATAPSQMKASFWAFMPNAPGGFVELVKAPFGEANRWDAFTLAASPEGVSITAQRYDDNPAPAVNVAQQLLDPTGAFGAWHHFDLVYDLRQSPKTCTVTIDKGAPYTLQLTSTRVLTGPVDFIVGPQYWTGASQTFDIYFDDFVLAPP